MNKLKVIKRTGIIEDFDEKKLINVISAAFKSVGKVFPAELINPFVQEITASLPNPVGVEEIQDKVARKLMDSKYFEVATSFILYREKHKEARFIRERIDYMNKYSQSNNNAASSSETDDNSNVNMKNVANLEGEVYKTTNRLVQRQRMEDKLKELFPEVAKQYERDLNNHVMYVHDEASSPVLKYYCCAVTLYPLMTEGVGNMDGITPTPPNDIQSFSGQVTNLAFLLSSQCKGAVAFGDYFVVLNYYVIQEFGKDWYTKLNDIVSTNVSLNIKTVKDVIRKGMKQFIWGVNQPASNRSFNSPFTNVSWYDRYYFKSLFENFYYPDGTQPEWEAIDCLQRMFMQLMREIRLITPITFPVTTMALVHNNKEFLDEEYKELCAEEWSKGGSFFCYNSDNPASLASCCRVLNEMSENTFSSTTGMAGVMTGSCSVITLNINRIVQDCAKKYSIIKERFEKDKWESCIKNELIDILERVYKYHIAYKTMLYDLEDKGMFAASNANYIYIKKLYSTIGVIGYMEAAEFLGLEIGNNDEYKEFLKLILGTINEENKKHSIRDTKRPFLFNSEAIPGESLGVKFYNWDKNDGYQVTEGRQRYNCYFFNPWSNISILDKINLHGKDVSSVLNGGQACHLNLDAHLSKEQYLKLMDIAMKDGCNYFTFNIPMSKCKDCNHIVNAPIKECPICHSKRIKYYTRIIGYLTAVDNWSLPMQQEFNQRVFEHIAQ